ncbi:hypothetical protein ACMBCM_06465 [Spiroplasma sp. K1]
MWHFSLYYYYYYYYYYYFKWIYYIRKQVKKLKDLERSINIYIANLD